MSRLPAVLVFCALLPAQTAPEGTPVKPKAADYPAHARAGSLEIGAEYMVRSFSLAGRTFTTGDYLVVEVALFPPKGDGMMISADAFSLRMNGKKQAILPQSPGMVAASLKYPDWGRRPRLEAGAGAGNTGIILGRPEPVERFPGDPRARTRIPAPPRAPEPERPGGIERQPEPTADEIAVRASLPEGQARGPVSGFLYFAYRGKTKALKSLELLYSGPEGTAVLKLLETTRRGGGFPQLQAVPPRHEDASCLNASKKP